MQGLGLLVLLSPKSLPLNPSESCLFVPVEEACVADNFLSLLFSRDKLCYPLFVSWFRFSGIFVEEIGWLLYTEILHLATVLAVRYCTGSCEVPIVEVPEIFTTGPMGCIYIAVANLYHERLR